MATVSLAIICKNERENLPRLFESVKGLFDEICVTDTGSTDGTLEYLATNPIENLKVSHFEWIDDFAAARNFSFSQCTSDYIAWLDGDDSLQNKEAFLKWKQNAMHLADYWLATYHYSMNEGKPVCSFTRERVFKRSKGFQWKYFVHEGVVPKDKDGNGALAQYATGWSIVHLRSAEDLEKDRSRNLNLLEKRKDSLDSRMTYYYGKELMENKRPKEAYAYLYKAISAPDLELHDRILAHQYAAMAACEIGEYPTAVSVCFLGVQLAPQRAEFYVLIGDCYLKMGRMADALVMYSAACNCAFVGGNSRMQDPIFNHEESYTFYPRHQMARILVHMGRFDKCLQLLDECDRIGMHKDTALIRAEVLKVKELTEPNHSVVEQSEDIVITCHPVGFYEWDEEIYKEKGIGGSETAAVRMARELHRRTGRRVIVFNNRENPKVLSGVEYRPAKEMVHYMRQYLPKVHIAWRHNVKITNAPTYLWCHDLIAQGIEHHHQYDYLLCLSEFHKNYVHTLFGVPLEKIIVTRNGIDPERFLQHQDTPKDKNKIVYTSSPDRGLDRALLVMDRVIKSIPSAKLYVYYGFDNLYKNGKAEEAKRLQGLCDERPYVVLRGNIEQRALAKELAKAVVWLYPTNFLETFGISAQEAVASRVYPVVRKWGALENTLEKEQKLGMADLIDLDCVTEQEIKVYSDHVIDAILNHKWEKLQVDLESMSWTSVARDWQTLMNL